MTPSQFRQLEIWWVDLEPTRGSETQKKRPCVVLQCDLVNRGSQTLIVAPILPGHKTWPFVVNIEPSSSNHLDKPRHINIKQIRAVDCSRFSNRQGLLETTYQKSLNDCIKLLFGIGA